MPYASAVFGALKARQPIQQCYWLWLFHFSIMYILCIEWAALPAQQAEFEPSDRQARATTPSIQSTKKHSNEI